jgi:NADH-quinone oxidoreductase subunit L
VRGLRYAPVTEFLWLVPALPLAGFIILALTLGKLSHKAVAWVGAGSIGLSALVAGLVAIAFIYSPPTGYAYTQALWTWMAVGGFKPAIAFYLDALSLTMMLVITFVGFFIHLYSTEFMAGEEGYSRFFAYMNLFVAFMLTLVLADNLLLLFLGWEGVGLCSYLLIGYWYREPSNGYAARKAFIVTRIGDAAMTIGLLLLFTQLGTLNIQELMQRATEQWLIGSGLAIAAAILLLGGAVGKSAQLPLQIWLPDAMAGPTPVSALIHAATMVTAGVYLIARMHVLYELAPGIQMLIAVLGAVTLFLAACAALTQTDIKRILAYSTMSQIGYMFMALGVGAWTAAIFHFMTHALFKALLFLSAGSVTMSLHHEHDIFKMGGIYTKLPMAFWSFLIGAATLAALPLITSGFYSKELILSQVWNSKPIGPLFWLVGLITAFITAVYIFRLVFNAFLGEQKTEIGLIPGNRIRIPLVVLSALSVVGGFIALPEFLRTALPMSGAHGESAPVLEWVAGAVALLGIYLAYALYSRKFAAATVLSRDSAVQKIEHMAYGGWGFDFVYGKAFVQPFLWLARINRSDFIDAIYRAATTVIELSYQMLSFTQTGVIRLYAGGLAAGAIIAVSIAVLW